MTVFVRISLHVSEVTTVVVIVKNLRLVCLVVVDVHVRFPLLVLQIFAPCRGRNTSDPIGARQSGQVLLVSNQIRRQWPQNMCLHGAVVGSIKIPDLQMEHSGLTGMSRYLPLPSNIKPVFPSKFTIFLIHQIILVDADHR